MALADRVIGGDRQAVARLISRIEDGAEGVGSELSALYPHTGRAHVVGVTGPPGGGKSTLVAQLAREYRRRDRTVGVIAVDPTSPYSGGAVLGDRVRMQGFSGDRGVFVRSMASRGVMGGLSQATIDAVRVLDAFGCQVVLVETVGAGQGEAEIARVAHTVVVVEVPGLGDEVQSLKAGILEIADLFVVNKADRDGADRVVRALQMMQEINLRPGPWVPPILKTVASLGKGVPELVDSLDRHLGYLKDSGEWERRVEANSERELMEAAKQEFVSELWTRLSRGELKALIQSIAERRQDPRAVARILLKRLSAGDEVAAGAGNGSGATGRD